MKGQLAVHYLGAAVIGLAMSDHRFDPALADEPPVLVVVVAAVAEHPFGAAAWPADAAADRRDAVEQLGQLGDVVAVAAGERPGERNPAAFDEEVVLAAPPAAIYWAGTGLGAPFFACT